MHINCNSRGQRQRSTLWLQAAALAQDDFHARKKIAEYANTHTEDNHIVTAMKLGFVAAAEQNLLEMSPAAPRRVSKNEPTLIPEGLVEYLSGEK